MSRVEEQLRQALARENPPEGFGARVLARAREEAVRAGQAREASWWRAVAAWLRPSRMRLVAVAALALITVIGVRYEQYRAEQQAGQRAKQEVLLALRVAGSKIRLAQVRVQHLSDPAVEGERDVPSDFRLSR